MINAFVKSTAPGIRRRLYVLIASGLLAPIANAQDHSGDWIRLFNGRDLSDWIVKIAKHDLGENYANTFRVEHGVLTVGYEGYALLDSQFGHLFFREPFSDYHLVVEYRFTGNWLSDTPDWARRNSGVPSSIRASGRATVGKVSRSRSTHCRRSSEAMQSVANASVSMNPVQTAICGSQSDHGGVVFP